MRLGLGLGIPYSLGGPEAAAFSPLDLSPALWLDASDTSTITEVGGAVSQWDDKSGNGNDVAQGTAALQPTTGTRTINGLNVLDFDGSDQLLVNGSTLSQPNTIFLVASFDAGGGASPYAISSSGTNSTVFSLLTTSSIRIFAGSNLVSSETCSFAPQIYGAIINGASSVIRVDGVATSGDAGSASLTLLSIGSSYNNLQDLNGAIAEVIIVDGTLTAGQITATESYLADKWGITL